MMMMKWNCEEIAHFWDVKTLVKIMIWMLYLPYILKTYCVILYNCYAYTD